MCLYDCVFTLAHRECSCMCVACFVCDCVSPLGLCNIHKYICRDGTRWQLDEQLGALTLWKMTTLALRLSLLYFSLIPYNIISCFSVKKKNSSIHISQGFALHICYANMRANNRLHISYVLYIFCDSDTLPWNVSTT